MPYDLEVECTDLELGSIFQDVDRIESITVGSDATNPLNHLSTIIPATTPMAPVRHASEEVGATVHDAGIWMPIRRGIVTDVDIDGVTFTVPDAEPFKAGDHIISIDATGPATGNGLDLALIVSVDYTANTIVVAATAGLVATDWVECLENCSVVLAANLAQDWLRAAIAGMLEVAHDARVALGCESTSPLQAQVVIEGAIREADINFNDDATDDMILIPQMTVWSTASGGVQIRTLEHGAEAVALPDL